MKPTNYDPRKCYITVSTTLSSEQRTAIWYYIIEDGKYNEYLSDYITLLLIAKPCNRAKKL